MTTNITHSPLKKLKPPTSSVLCNRGETLLNHEPVQMIKGSKSYYLGIKHHDEGGPELKELLSFLGEQLSYDILFTAYNRHLQNVWATVQDEVKFKAIIEAADAGYSSPYNKDSLWYMRQAQELISLSKQAGTTTEQARGYKDKALEFMKIAEQKSFEEFDSKPSVQPTAKVEDRLKAAIAEQEKVTAKIEQPLLEPEQDDVPF